MTDEQKPKVCPKCGSEEVGIIKQEVCGDAEPVANEMQLNIIRYWPDGFADRLEHVWKDLIGFIPNYKLYDLKRVLAEFGFTMQIYEGAAPTKAHPAPAVVRQLVEALEDLLGEAEDGIATCPLTRIKARQALAAAEIGKQMGGSDD